MSLGRVFLVSQWSFGQLLLTPRTLGMLAVSWTPVFIALGYRVALAFGVAERTSGFGVFSVLTASVAFPFVVPMLSRKTSRCFRRSSATRSKQWKRRRGCDSTSW